MRRLVGLVILSLASCGGPPQRGPMSLAAADYRVKQAPLGTLLEQAQRDQEKTARAWMDGHVAEVDKALADGDPLAALGIASTLHKVALDRHLDKLDSELVQPVLARVIEAAIVKSTSADRRELEGLLGFLDAQHDAGARAAAGKKFQAQLDALQGRAQASEAKGYTFARYVYGALLDYYAMKRVDDVAKSAREADVRAATSIEYTVMDATDCHSTTGTINDFNHRHAQRGRSATVHVRIPTCTVEQTEDQVTVETKTWGRFSAGTTTVTKTDGQYEHRDVLDSSGRVIRTEGTGHYIQGTTSTSTTSDSYVPQDVQVNVHRSKHHYEMQGTISIDGDVPATSVPLAVTATTSGESWEPLTPLTPDGRWLGEGPKYETPTGPELMQKGMDEALESAVKATERAVSQQLAAAARGATGEEAVDKYAVALFLDHDGEALGALATALQVPAADLKAAVQMQTTYEAKSAFAYRLAEPDGLNEIDRREIDKGFGDLEHKTGGVLMEAVAGVQTSKPTRIDPPAMAGATAAEASSSYGLGVGLRVMGTKDPGRAESTGLIGGGGGELRLGYAGGAFFDLQIPLYVGLRVNGVGVAVRGAVGWNKLGKDEAGDLWVRNAPYVGYGLDVSYLTWGMTDFAGSYGRYHRGETWQQPDDFGIDPDAKYQIVGDEVRYELRMIRWAHGQDPATTFTARYSTFTGDSKDGYSFTFWVGVMGDAR